jgi:hypothetical protein
VLFVTLAGAKSNLNLTLGSFSESSESSLVPASKFKAASESKSLELPPNDWELSVLSNAPDIRLRLRCRLSVDEASIKQELERRCKNQNQISLAIGYCTATACVTLA